MCQNSDRKFEAAMHQRETGDGGLIEWDGWADIVDIGGNRGVPATFSFSHPGGPEQPAFRFDFGVQDGIPVCTNATVTAKEGVPVRGRDLRIVRLDDLLVSVVQAVAYRRDPDDPPGHWMRGYGPGEDLRYGVSNRRAAERALAKRRNRSPRNSVDLELVARTWLEAPKDGQEAALMAVFGKSRSTVQRYKRQAVEEGYLTEDEGRRK
ncbi:hypothetical protein C5O27_17170 [Gordonia alkanivorans]|nr:hypothetical protein C5O27_17170 [Gordonia alkanivorans]